MNISSYTWVIFDGDDTLWQTTALYDDARTDFCRWLAAELNKRRTISAASASQISAYQQRCDKELYTFLHYSAARFPRSFEATVRHHLPNLDPKELTPLLITARKMGEAVFSKRALPYAGAEQLLRSLKARRIKTGLLTGGDPWVQEKRIQDFPWRGLFNWIKIVSDLDQDESGKPAKEVELLKFKKRYQGSTEQFLFVGDSLTSDVIPSVKAGLDALWIAHPNWDREQEHDGTVIGKDQEALSKTLTLASLDPSKSALVERLDEIASFLELALVNNAPCAPDAPLFAYVVFEGGGAKGLAYVGGFKACEQRNIKFLGVAGTSSGSIVAGLIAAGYTADELFNDNNGLLKTADFPDIIGFENWETSKKLKRLVDSFSNSFWAGALHAAVLGCVIKQTVKRKGAVDTSPFRDWYNACLSKKLFPNEEVREISFAMIRVAYLDRLKSHLDRRPDLVTIGAKNGNPLKIVATDVSERAVIVYPDDGDEHMAVADAVAASMAIPFVFQPKSLDVKGASHRHVDGGALANFPVWSLRNRIGRFGDVVPLLGFRLVEKIKKMPDDSFYGYMNQLVTTVIDGSSGLATRGIEDFYEIPLLVSASSFDFDMSGTAKSLTFAEGIDATRRFFLSPDALMLVTQEQMSSQLAKIQFEMLKFLDLPDAYLRVNVVARRPPGRKLHVRYSYNMEFDSDDHLEFEEEMAGGVGVCWNSGETCVIDLTDARATFGEYNMSKGEQALIRRSLKSLLCVPIFDPRDKSETDLSKKRKLGILNFDSDDDLFSAFLRKSVKDFAVRQAVDLALYWIELTYKGQFVKISELN